MPNAVREIFKEIPRTYELINHILTFGMDIFWRRRTAKAAAVVSGKNKIDLCSGTGETASYLKNYSKNGSQIYAVDFCLPMLKEAAKKPQCRNIKFTAGEIKKLPFADNSFDAATISFATRNINTSRASLIAGFKEIHRILKPGGHFFNLETSQPSSLILRKLFHFYIKLLVASVGGAISGSARAYKYLSTTIPLFYSAGELADILREAEFKEVRFKKIFFGIAAIHHCLK
ncbi:MAG: hypothetical protein COV72_08980 [Candidatus Omnitrophica bacterium CG11_big_fil_rev_8_21_14_0_20_42_13]|uniref:Demethylmenaquinone methyltransferase n=1 Tax=Candidatus Ghiorseimicrobium undicola TaxID=1974746 RepID=A0A2H0LVP1_9BACT|nr:MAG: hypothetical protein COV72_08980 [Candidatus Omnitrophica bacterium CG11_big_fil_rev_8_21_14_0_20_42_13]